MPNQDTSEDDTSFIQRAGGALRTKKAAVVGGGTGLSVAAVIWIYATFVSKTEMEKVRQSQATQWNQITELRKDVNELRAHARAYEMLLEYVSGGQIKASLTITNKTN